MTSRLGHGEHHGEGDSLREGTSECLACDARKCDRVFPRVELIEWRDRLLPVKIYRFYVTPPEQTRENTRHVFPIYRTTSWKTRASGIASAARRIARRSCRGSSIALSTAGPLYAYTSGWLPPVALATTHTHTHTHACPLATRSCLVPARSFTRLLALSLAFAHSFTHPLRSLARSLTT